MSWNSQTPPQRAQDVIGNVSLERNGVVVTSVKGNLTDQRVDVIVNTTGRDLKLDKSGVSSAIFKSAGQAIQDECNQNKPNGIGHGEFCVTDGYNLNCSKVYHGSLPPWQDKSATQNLKDLIAGCLEEAHGNSYTSIAFPALGAGGLKYPKDKVAKHVFEEVLSFANNHAGTTLKDIRFVVFHADKQTLEAFDKEINFLSGKSASGYWTPRGPYTLETKDGVIVKSIKGSITQQTVDVIVNTTTRSLDITSGGGVSSAIANAAGAQTLQQACQKASPNGINYGEICETSGGNLPCKYIYHSAVPDWSDSSAEQVLRDLIEACLDQADTDGFVSIAFPAIGTGGQKYPHDKVARIFFEQIEAFSKGNNAASLLEVGIVLFEKDVNSLKAFDVEIKRLTGTPVLAEPAMAKVPPGNPKPRASKKKWVDVSVFQGDLTQETSHAVVNGTTDKMSMEAEVSIALLKAGGTTVQDDVDQVAKAGITEVAVTTAGNLPSDHIIHVVVPSTDSGNIDHQKWQRAITMCLTKANNMELQSISFPALGTGKMGSDPSEMANILCRSIYSYLRTCPVYSLEQIRIVVFHAAHVSVYDNALKNAKSNTNPGATSGSSAAVFTAHKFPTEWNRMMPDQVVLSVPLKTSDKEYAHVKHNFVTSLGSTNVTIIQIDRIQNQKLYLGYQLERSIMEQMNRAGVQNERKLWHGTSQDAISDINSTGFNRSYCGKNATAYGEGVYFAMNASYSDNPTYSKPDTNGHKYMYQSLVLAGEFTQGKSGFKVPPVKDKKTVIRFDSVVNSVTNPSIFVVFYDNKAYPEYLITYKK